MNKKIPKILTIAGLVSLSLVYYQSFIKADITLLSLVRGKILLQVEANGEAWYVNPLTDERYFLGRPDNAFDIMRNQGIGITNEEIKKIPIALIDCEDKYCAQADSDGDGLSDLIEDAIGTDKHKADSDGDGYDDRIEVVSGHDPLSAGKLPISKEFTSKQVGKILIQVEQNGEAWYVNPNDQKRYYLGRPHDAFNAMRYLAIGITNDNLAQIPEFTTDKTLLNNYIVDNYTSSVDNSTRQYTDPRYSFSFKYPRDWKIQKTSTSDNVLYLGDYESNLFLENKSMVYASYLTKEQPTNLTSFTIKEKPDAKKTMNQKIITTANSYEAMIEKFEYDGLKSYEITAIIKKNDHEFMHLMLISGSLNNEYQSIFENIIHSVKF